MDQVGVDVSDVDGVTAGDVAMFIGERDGDSHRRGRGRQTSPARCRTRFSAASRRAFRAILGSRPLRYREGVSRPVRIAVAQYEPHVGELEQNRSQAVRWATAAADQGADLIVLPGARVERVRVRGRGRGAALR